MKILRKLYYWLPPALRMFARRVVFMPIDGWELLTQKKHKLQPPRGMIYTGSGDFMEQGKRFLEYFVQYGNLCPNENVLDVGSGIGRMAVPLTSFLLPETRYEGFDVVETGVNWCKKNISTSYPNFHFQYIPLENDLYTSGGIKANTFHFPYEEATFDFVFLTSVFTHMMPDEVVHYLKEISRVLKPGGRCFATFFILTPESEAAMNETKTFWFPYSKGVYSLMEEKVTAANVAYQWEYLEKECFPTAGLKVKDILGGKWSGIPKYLDFQDIVVLIKP